MGNHNSWYVTEKSQKSIAELKLNKVGVLLQIIDELKEMNLSVRDIETVLGACGLSYRDAMQMGNDIRAARREKYR